LNDEQFQLLDAYVSLVITVSRCLKQPQLFNNGPFNYIETVDGSFVNRFPFLPDAC